jgi:hypothetical protein
LGTARAAGSCHLDQPIAQILAPRWIAAACEVLPWCPHCVSATHLDHPFVTSFIDTSTIYRDGSSDKNRASGAVTGSRAPLSGRTSERPASVNRGQLVNHPGRKRVRKTAAFKARSARSERSERSNHMRITSRVATIPSNEDARCQVWCRRRGRGAPQCHHRSGRKPQLQDRSSKI